MPSKTHRVSLVGEKANSDVYVTPIGWGVTPYGWFICPEEDHDRRASIHCMGTLQECEDENLRTPVDGAKWLVIVFDGQKSHRKEFKTEVEAMDIAKSWVSFGRMPDKV